MDAAVPGIGGEQFAEIAFPHQGRRHGLGLGLGVPLANPIFGDEPEELLPPFVEDLRNQNRAADRKPEVVVAERRREVGGCC